LALPPIAQSRSRRHTSPTPVHDKGEARWRTTRIDRMASSARMPSRGRTTCAGKARDARATRATRAATSSPARAATSNPSAGTRARTADARQRNGPEVTLRPALFRLAGATAVADGVPVVPPRRFAAPALRCRSLLLELRQHRLGAGLGGGGGDRGRGFRRPLPGFVLLVHLRALLGGEQLARHLEHRLLFFLGVVVDLFAEHLGAAGEH